MPADTEPETEDAGGGFPALADATPSPLILTGLNQPLWLQNSTYPAAVDRQLIAAAFGTGVLGPGELAVSQRAAGANLSVDVAVGRAIVAMTDSPNQASALCVSTSVNNLVIAGAPGAGLTRIDRIIARVYDASLIGGSVNGWQLEVVTGTPAASPAAPAMPASSIPLARVTIASGTASITTGLITDERVLSMTPTGERAYAQITVDKPITASTLPAADVIVTAPAVNFDGVTPVIVEFFSPGVTPGATATNSVNFWLFQDGVSTGRATVMNPGGSLFLPVHISRRLTPTAGSHTFSFRGTGAGTVSAGPGGSSAEFHPTYIRIVGA